jgi:deoxyribodipyrimidine photolyase-related protein
MPTSEYNARVQHVFVLGDQLTTQVGPLARATPEDTVVLIVESVERGAALPYHKQKLALIYSAMRHFARELEAQGFGVCYRRAHRWTDGIQAHLREFPGAKLEMMEPTDYGVREPLQMAIENAGGTLEVVENELWLSGKEDWARFTKGRKQWRMEYFYRQLRERTGWLMDGPQPIGGRFNFDAENRDPPPRDHRFPPKLTLAPDALTLETFAWVEQTFPDHFGSLEGFNWPVTRAQALEALEHFLDHRLAGFGPYEDAMLSGENQLYHSLISPAMNLGLLTAREVCEAALERASEVPLQSLEGFIRQVLGWREFMHHVYDVLMPGLHDANALEHHAALPDLYWTGETKMRCLSSSVKQLLETGHTHHIQRLMVLGNFALLLGVSPQAVNEWFLLGYVDAYDWVVTPNVVGMSQHAMLDRFTSKPYIAGGAYINRMGDYCGGCAYNPKLSSGATACPFTTLYWDFIHRHAARFQKNPRMGMVVNAWRKRDPEDRRAILERTVQLKRELEPTAKDTKGR